MITAPTVLFICSGNIFRSMSAEYALRAHLGAEEAIGVSSAGLYDAPHGIVDFVRDHLEGKDIDITQHRPTRLTQSMLDRATLPVAMGFEHRDAIERDFERRLPLFSELAYGTEEPLRDVWEVVPDWQNNETEAAAYGCSVIDYIYDGMPGFLQRLPGFLPRT